METLEELREYIAETTEEEVLIFTNYDYAPAFIGLSHDNRAVYSYTKMVEYLMVDQGFSEEEALEWISFNTLGSLPPEDHTFPIILMDTTISI